MEETGDVLLVGEEPREPAQAKLEGAVAPAAALLEQGPPATLEHPLRQGGDPQGGQRQPQQEALDPFGPAHPAALPLPAKALQVAEEFLFPGAMPIVR